MTVKVFTDYGIKTYDNANKYRVDDEGVLWVDNAATFNRGVWTHVELENVEPKKEPRVWGSLADVPVNTEVTSQKRLSSLDDAPLHILVTERGNSKYKWGWQSSWTNWFKQHELSGADNNWAPFTEVLS